MGSCGSPRRKKNGADLNPRRVMKLWVRNRDVKLFGSSPFLQSYLPFALCKLGLLEVGSHHPAVLFELTQQLNPHVSSTFVV